MKAYEIKVTIKGSKPPIWRKVIIPEGINFMQLHNTIQVAFEWLNYHLYEFSFKEFPEKITNDHEAVEEYEYYNSKEWKDSLGMGAFRYNLSEVLLAEDVKIDKYFKAVKKFKYIYDFGDWWEHTIEILNYIDDYEYDYPQVTKFKQASPPDDCGGIDGYYEFLERINDKSDPEYDMMVEWGESQGYHNDYNMDEINEALEEILDFNISDYFDFL